MTRDRKTEEDFFDNLIKRLKRIGFDEVGKDFCAGEPVEFSCSPKEFKGMVRCTLKEFIVTLSLLFLIKDSRIIDHWKNDCFVFFSKYNDQIEKLKAKNLNDFLYNCLWEGSEFVDSKTFMKALKEKICKENKADNNTQELPFSNGYLYVKDIIGEFMWELASRLAKGKIPKDDFKELIDKYRSKKCFQPEKEWMETFS